MRVVYDSVVRGWTVKLPISPKAKEFIVEKGSDKKYGARPLRRMIQNMIEDPLAEEVLKGNAKAGSVVTITCKNDKLIPVCK